MTQLKNNDDISIETYHRNEMCRSIFEHTVLFEEQIYTDMNSSIRRKSYRLLICASKCVTIDMFYLISFEKFDQILFLRDAI